MTASTRLADEPQRRAQWQAKYSDQLLELADRDEWSEEYSWPTLKQEIKQHLEQSFHHWPASSSPILHPAAALIPLNSNSMDDDASTSTSSLLGLGNGHSKGHGAELNPSNGHASAQAAYSAALTNRFVQGGNSDGGDGPLGGSSNEDADAMGLDQDISVKEADMQAFFPSKRQAPAEWRGSWGERIDTAEELAREQALIFSMLDDFENQPPFTIQRLAELVVNPTEHHHTLPKYISALKRVLSVTATRDAFPTRTDEAEEELIGDEVAATELQNGAGGATPSSAGMRSMRSTPVPGSPATAPLFSPIPFLMQSGDEGMPGAGPEVRQADSSEEAVSDRDVPTMELGGADRTTEEATHAALRTGKGVGSSRSVVDGALEVAKAAAAEPEAADIAAAPRPATADEQSSNALASANAVEAQHASASLPVSDPPTIQTPSSAATEPLGIPAGPVDEVDQVGQNHGQLKPLEPGAVAGGATAFSATTTDVPSVSMAEAAAPAGTSDNVSLPADGDSGRALKRIRSDRHLGETHNEQGGQS